MKKILSLIAVFIVIYLVNCPAMAAPVVTTDGDLTEWGLEALKTNDWSIEQTWIPTRNDVYFIVENNHNPAHHITPSGVHIKGTSLKWVISDEPKRVLRDSTIMESEPFGGEPYDLEAMYFSQDADKIYVAVITSLNPYGAGDLRPGDLALNLGSGGQFGYEWGIKFSALSPFEQGSIIKNPVWQGKGYLLPVGPDVITGGTDTGKKAEITYNGNWLAGKPEIQGGKEYPNYVIEASINKSDIGSPKQVSINELYYEDNCLNDRIYVPEFPTIALSIGMIGGIIFVIFIYRDKKN